MEFFKNISVNLKAKGIAAVYVVWILAIAALGLYGDGPLAGKALSILSFFGFAFLGMLGFGR